MIIPDYCEPIVGYRGWRITLPLCLKSLTRSFPWHKLEKTIAKHDTDELLSGLYAYNNYYNYNNRYNYNNNNNNKNNNNYYYYNYNYNNYYVAGEVYLWGKIHKHKLGYRADFGYPKLLFLFDKHPKQIKLINKDKKFCEFIEHFNNLVKEVANEYKVPTANYHEYFMNKEKENVIKMDL